MQELKLIVLMLQILYSLPKFFKLMRGYGDKKY
jgi:hypothetical protein